MRLISHPTPAHSRSRTLSHRLTTAPAPFRFLLSITSNATERALHYGMPDSPQSIAGALHLVSCSATSFRVASNGGSEVGSGGWLLDLVLGARQRWHWAAYSLLTSATSSREGVRSACRSAAHVVDAPALRGPCRAADERCGRSCAVSLCTEAVITTNCNFAAAHERLPVVANDHSLSPSLAT
jgi:hypothetical protein